MGNAKGLLETRLPRLLSTLETPGFLLMEESEREQLMGKARSIAERLEKLGSTSLVIGIVGGTGVGKSTLMNALAGSEIAHTSHRRPDTDAVLIYRHASSEVQAPDAQGIKFKEILHSADEVKEIILCDLPDFDSLVKEHREQVASFLGQLDMVIWAVSPEKYADARFYDLLGRTIKSKENFLFVLNKTDLLFDGVSPDEGERRLKALMEIFLGHLTSSGIERPVIFNVSARKAESKDATWNRLTAFKEAVFKRRDEKQILAIKAANLEEELKAIIGAIEEKRLSLVKLSEAIHSGRQKLLESRPLWLEAATGPIDHWIRNYLKPAYSRLISRELPLAGWPGRLFNIIGSARAEIKRNERTIETPFPVTLPPEAAELLLRHIEFFEDRIVNNLRILKSIPEGVEEKLTKALDSRGLFAVLEASLTTSATSRFTSGGGSRHFLFKTLQKAAYFLAFLLFLAAIASAGSWETFIKAPGLSTLFPALFSTLRNLFSASGLSTLLTYIMITLFIGLRFYIKAKGIVEAEADSALRSLRRELLGIWEEAYGELDKRATAFAAAIDSEQASAARITEWWRKKP